MASIKDIANRTGLSIATVSRALNGASTVREDTRERVLRIARELDYHPNAVARSLVRKRSRIFGYIVSGLVKGAKHTIIQDSLVGIYEFARSVGYEILMFAVDSRSQRAKSYMDFAREHALAGLIIQGLRTDDEYYRDILDSELPCVLIDLSADSERVGSVSIDNRAAARDVVRYLASKGHTRIAFMSGMDGAAVSAERYLGYRAGLEEAGLERRDAYCLRGDFSEDEAYTVAMRFLPRHPEVSALFCASDLMAMGALRAARELALAVPERLSIVGFDDILVASHTAPPLTTVHQDFCAMGFEAAKMLSNIVSGEAVPHTRNMPYRLVIRASA